MSGASSTSSSSSNKPPLTTAESIGHLVQNGSKPVISVLTIVLPIAIDTTRRLYHEFQKLPQNALLFLYGSVFCFFGGTFPTLFAALQAAEHGGRETVIQALCDLSSEAMIIVEESKKDDDADDDKNGKKDSNELSGQELFLRKSKLVLRKMNPEKIDRAIGSLYTVWMSVAAVLSIKFARTISMALSIAEFMEKPAHHYVAPVIQAAIPNEYDKWIPIVLSWIMKSFAMSIAWYIQSVVSATASALQGGLMMARATLQFCTARGMTLGGMIPDDTSKTNVDEYLSYGFAGMGFYFQLRSGFDVRFPLSLILWPFELAEYYIRWTITKRD